MTCVQKLSRKFSSSWWVNDSQDEQKLMWFWVRMSHSLTHSLMSQKKIISHDDDLWEKWEMRNPKKIKLFHVFRRKFLWSSSVCETSHRYISSHRCCHQSHSIIEYSTDASFFCRSLTSDVATIAYDYKPEKLSTNSLIALSHLLSHCV